MASEAIRDLGYIAWRDPRAWMESMRGERWRTLVKAETARFRAGVETAVEALLPSPEAAVALALSFEAAQKEEEAGLIWTVDIGGGTGAQLNITPVSGSAYSWTFVGEDVKAAAARPLAGGIDIAPRGIVLYTTDVRQGAEHYTLYATTRTAHTPLWSFTGGKGGVAGEIVVVGDRVYCIEGDAALQYRRVVSLNTKTGGDRASVLEGTSPQISLSLVRGDAYGVFVLGEDAGRQFLWHVPLGGAKAQQLDLAGVSFMPLGTTEGGLPAYFVRRGSYASPWVPVNLEWQLPAGLGRYGLEDGDLGRRFLVLRRAGMRWLLHCSPRRPPKLIARGIAEYAWNPWMPNDTTLHVVRPGVSSTGTLYANTRSGFARSEDGTAVRWILCRGAQDAPLGLKRGLLVVAYGAYGIPTSLSTARWRPWLEHGWDVGFALVRGSGDDTETWAEAGRLAGKKQGVEDLEAVVRALQEETGTPPARTALFGRSAGGYLVGAAVVRAPRGRRFAGVLTEVPYVDVLRTTTNPALPLTSLEFNEFGHPAERIADMQTLLQLSPVDGLPPSGAPGVTVVCRTAENDRQVYAYEAVKWIQALRGTTAAGAPKLVFVRDGQGHFTRGYSLFLERAEDLCLMTHMILGGISESAKRQLVNV